MLLGVASSVVAVVALSLLLPQPKPPPEADKSPGPPKLAINSSLLGSYLLGPMIGLRQKHISKTNLDVFGVDFRSPDLRT